MSALIQAHAQPPSGAAAGAVDQQQYLTFVLRGEAYAMGILAIKEIIEYGAVTEVPRMPSFIRGVINLRGVVVPVIDLTVRFGKPSTEVSRRTCIVIVEVANDGGTQVVGVVVDAVSAVLAIPAAQIEPPPSFGASIRTDFISGIGKIDGKFVIILDIQHVLSIDDMASLTAIHGAASDPADTALPA